LNAIAKRRGGEVVEGYRDAGFSGAKGRDERPGLDPMLNDASKGKFDVVMVWAIDRLGLSLIDLLTTIKHLEACKTDVFIEQQNVDTTTPMGKRLFQITGAFAEFGRHRISQRVAVGIKRARASVRPSRQAIGAPEQVGRPPHPRSVPESRKQPQ
jgi:DNA invertase Pin-like site-specific DNA recombinase